MERSVPDSRRIGLIGFGAVGVQLARHLASTGAHGARIVGILVRDPGRYAARATDLDVPIVDRLERLLAESPEVVVEAASHEAFRTYVPELLRRGIDVLAISVGALADSSVHAAVIEAARSGGGRLRIPSGAIAGLDAIGAAALGGLDRVIHEVRKPPIALLSSDEAARVAATGHPRQLFSGSAREVAARFPANANVVAAVALAGLGLDATEARVIADPGVNRNTHQVQVEGSFGRLTIRIENTPSDNPKTGRIVALSLLRAIDNLSAPIVFGP